MIEFILHGEIPVRITDMARRAHTLALARMGWTDWTPLIDIREDLIVTKDGTFYSMYHRGTKHIYLCYKAAASVWRGDRDAELAMTCYCIAHETVHFVQDMEDRLVFVLPMNADAYYQHPTEEEAHRIGNEILSAVFGCTCTPGDLP